MSEKLVLTERFGAVDLIRLAHGITNALNAETVAQLGDALERARLDPSVRGIVFGSANDKFLSMGLDLPSLLGLSKDRFRVFLETFSQVCLDLFVCPKPTVAAITGHAPAGGCILALCCDYRFMAEGRKAIGLNEVRLGVPVPFLTDRMLRQIVGGRHARDIADSGELYGPEAALQMGLVDQVLPLSEVVSKALEWAEKLGAHPGSGWAEIKRNRVAVVLDQWRANADEANQRMLDCWYSDAAQARLREAAAKF